MRKEVWRPVVGWKGFYEVSNLGRIKSLARTIMRSNGIKQTFRERILADTRDDGGYPQATLMRPGKVEHVRVHVVVCRAFRGIRPIGYEVAHKDGVRSNCMLSNLGYKSYKGNREDMIRHGNSARGIKNGSANLTPAKVRKIRALQGVMRRKDVAEKFGTTAPNVGFIWNETTWGWLK